MTDIRRTRGGTVALVVTLEATDALEAIGTQALTPTERASLRATKASLESLRLSLTARLQPAALDLVARIRQDGRP